MQQLEHKLSRRRCSLGAILVLAAAAQSGASAQGTRADYERAAGLQGRTQNRVFKGSVRPAWFASGSRFWYRNGLAGGTHEFIHVHAEKGVREPAFDHTRLAAALSIATGKTYTPERLPFDRIEFVEGEDAVRFASDGKGWKWDRKTSLLTEGEPPPAPPTTPQARREGPRGEARSESPDRRWRAVIRDHNIHLRDNRNGEERALTSDGTADDAYEERVYWSPDSKKLAAFQTKKGGSRTVNLVESSPRDQLQPKLHSVNYLKPGDPLPQRRPRLFDVLERKQIPVSEELCTSSWSVDDLRWEPDSRRFTFLYNQRGHRVLRIIAVDSATGEARAIVDEQSPTFIDYAHKRFTHYLDRSGELIWMSERDGWNHLYLYDAQAGTVKNAITRGEWVVRGVERVDEDKRQVWFRASGIDPREDPYHVHYCRVNFDGTGLLRLTEGDGAHSIVYSPDRRFYIDSYSRVDLPTITELRRAEDGARVCELERADWSALLAEGWKIPERFSAKGRDGTTDVFGVIFRPTNFEPARKYRVIEDIYAGPQGSFVPKTFQAFHRPQALAELGFIVVQIDGMGTSNRSKAFHDVCARNLGDAGLPDRILWIRAAAARYPSMDLDRVGVYGVSAGGQNSLRALLAHPEFYKVGVSACGCHDNRMDKIWWNELWMGWPVGPHYDEQSNVTQAHRLQGKLLLIVGEMDTNVDPASTMQVVNALVRADKDFDLVVVPGAGHGIGGAYGVRRMHDFFVRHLLGVEPRRE